MHTAAKLYSANDIKYNFWNNFTKYFCLTSKFKKKGVFLTQAELRKLSVQKKFQLKVLTIHSEI